jgi:large repetitive protein
MTNANPRKYAAWFLSLVLVATLVPLAGPAGAVGTFDDDDGNIHESAIEDIAALGITLGCNPPANTLYCPDDYVTRQQMASFLVRTFDLPPGPDGQFTDISGSVHENDINALAASGITRGCNPPANDQYCPRDVVTRGQMAAFMARGLGLDNVADPDFFADDDSNIFELQINAIARVGITRGCNPPANTEYCPDNPVRRDEMATFLSRVAAIVNTGTTSTTTPGSTTTTTPGSTTTTTLVPGGDCYTTVPADPNIINMPYANPFGPDQGGLCDVGNDGTGFTWAAPTSNGTRYNRANLDVTGGRLEVITTSGLFEGGENTQSNALSIPLNPQISIRAEATISDPPAGTGNFEQAGVWFGNGQDDYVKVVMLSNLNGTAVQTRLEVGGTPGTTRTLQLAGLPNTIDLRLDANLPDLEVQGQYRVDGGSWQNIGAPVTVPIEFFTIDQAGTTTETFVGLLTSHRNGPSPLTYAFDRFDVSNLDTGPGGGGGPFSFDVVKTAVGYKPTAMEWYGNRLYVLDVLGVVHRYIVNANGSLQADGSFNRLPNPPSGTSYTALGLAVQPGSSTTNPTVWISTSLTGGSNFLEGVANSSTVWRVTDITTTGNATAMITGLPRAYENHAINSIRFYDGFLYIAQGGNTGAGAPNTDPGTGPPYDGSAFGTRPEQPLSAAWLRADVLNGWSPANNGNCATAVDDGDVTWDSNGNATVNEAPTASKVIPGTCDVVTLATGLRNMYDFVKHSDGFFYGADNGLGVNGTVPVDPAPDCQGLVDPYPDGKDPGPQPDRLHRLQTGNYYGHPNPARDECVFFTGNFQGVAADPDFTANLQQLNNASGQSPRSLNSIIEYKSGGTAFGGDFDGDLLITAFAGTAQGLFRYDFAEGCGANVSAYNNGCLPQVVALGAPLSLTQISQGRLVVGEWNCRQCASSNLVVMTPDD